MENGSKVQTQQYKVKGQAKTKNKAKQKVYIFQRTSQVNRRAKYKTKNQRAMGQGSFLDNISMQYEKSKDVNPNRSMISEPNNLAKAY